MEISLGNFFTVRDISKKYDLQVLRFFMLSAHYRSPLNFSADQMESAAVSLERIRNAVENLKYLETASEKNMPADTAMTQEEQALLSEAMAFETKFDDAMDDDLNTADAIAAIFELVKFANSHSAAENTPAYLKGVKDEIVKLCDILGLIVEKKEELLDDEIEKLIEERQAARKAKNFARADEIRNLLAEKGIQLLDTREGVKWKRA